MSMESTYNPKQFENQINSQWRDNLVGQVDTQIKNNPDLETTHSILMPPPNLTGVLHAGHSFQHYLMDTISRIHRQNGELNLWQPGVDHAGIQLEGVIDKMFKNGDIALSDVIALHPQFPTDIDELPKFLKTNYKDFWLEKAWEKVNEWRDIQKNQAEVLGDTPDYSKNLFTLDPRAVEMVHQAFLDYYEDGLIYKKSYMINWSVGLQTALSDVPEDIGHETRKDPFVTIKYQLALSPSSEYEPVLTDNFIKVTTVRPETVFSDQFVLINEYSAALDDEILEKIKGSQEAFLVLPLSQTDLFEDKVYLPIQLTSDSNEVDPEFGTGALKVTPAHDIHDYEMYEKYKLKSFKIVDGKRVPRNPFVSSVERSGKLSEIAGEFKGLTVMEGRKQIIKALIERELIPLDEGSTDFDESKIEKWISNYFSIPKEDVEGWGSLEVVWDYEHNVTICERSKTIVEPLISEEFFLSYHTTTSRDGKTLAELALEGIKETNYYPNNFTNLANNFVENIHDWCISRNLVWGHSMPIWYNTDINPSRKFFSKDEVENDPMKADSIKVQVEKPTVPGTWIQEEKILDTWFSSCLWPLSTLGYYNAVQDVKWEDIPAMIDNSQGAQEEHDFFKFYSTDEMITAREIFYAWVVRMTMLGKYFTGRVPFKSVVITPTIQDEKGRKMSKSLKNGLDPVESINNYSSDSLRLAMLSGMYPNRNMRMGGDLADRMLEKYRNFGNKLWNVARFLQEK